MNLTPTIQYSNHLTVIHLNSVQLEDIVKEKLLFVLKENPLSLLETFYGPIEQAVLEQALEDFRGNQLKTAKALGINRNTLKKKMDFYKINLEVLLNDFRSPALSKNEIFTTSPSYLPLLELSRYKIRAFAEKKDFYKVSPLKSLCAPIEQAILEQTLHHFRKNQLKTAKALGINRNTLKKKMDEIKKQND